MESGPLVSVILIFFNAEKFLEEAIESVFRQTYENWELLLIDDGSSDRSGPIALSYQKRHPGRVRCLRHAGGKNLGMSASRNLGVRQARGEYVAFLDADDVWGERKLEEQEAILRREPEAAMVYGATEYWYSWTGRPDDLARDFIPALGVQPDRLFKPPQLLSVVLRNQIVTTTNGLVRREAVESIGGFEESFRGLYEDQAFFAKISVNSPVFVASRCWYRYRRHPDSCCAREESAGLHLSKRLLFLGWLRGYLLQKGVEDSGVWQALAEQEWKSNHPTLSRLFDHARYRLEVMKELLKSVARRLLPDPIYHWMRVRRHGVESRPPVGRVSFGALRRVTPISTVFGYDRGQPIDRYYIENFLARHSEDVRGRVLEIGDDTYTRRFGGDRVIVSDVLHVLEGNPKATIIADLTEADHVPSDAFDCIILTQTLHLIYDVRAALSTLRRILKPGGVLLTTFPGISQIDHYDWGNTWYWGFTALSARRLFAEFFPEDNVTVEAHGNVLTSIAFLHGLSSQELRKEELDHRDSDYQVTIAVKARKGEA